MKKVGIIFAMGEELSSLKKYIRLKKEYNIFNLKFYEGELNGIYCILVQSGVGKVNAARTTQILIDNMKVDYIFNIGVAGAVSENLNIGDIVIAEKLVQYDFDITAFNHKMGYIPDIGVYIYSDKYLLELAKSVTSDDSKLFSGVIASGDMFCSDYMMSEKINNEFNALCVEMEGAAIAQVCYLCNIPFLILRSISDTPNSNDNVITYEEFLLDLCERVSNVMSKILFNMSNG